MSEPGAEELRVKHVRLAVQSEVHRAVTQLCAIDRRLGSNLQASRELSLAKTKLDEARLWLLELLRRSKLELPRGEEGEP